MMPATTCFHDWEADEIDHDLQGQWGWDAVRSGLHDSKSALLSGSDPDSRVVANREKATFSATATGLLITAGIRRTPLLTLSPTMFNILLVPLDGSPQSVHVIDLASRVAAPGAATVHLLCAVDPCYFLPPGCESGVAPDGLTYPPAHAQTSFAQTVLAAAAAQLADRHLTVEQHLCAGSPPADIVIEQARLLTAEVIVMGHHHLSRLRRWANPSTCGEVIERSPCAVLIETREKD